jgi:hypothetical protein
MSIFSNGRGAVYLKNGYASGTKREAAEKLRLECPPDRTARRDVSELLAATLPIDVSIRRALTPSAATHSVLAVANNSNSGVRMTNSP